MNYDWTRAIDPNGYQGTGPVAPDQEMNTMIRCILKDDFYPTLNDSEYTIPVQPWINPQKPSEMLYENHDKYDVGSGELFDDLVGLIEHLRSYPIIETSGDILRLLQPVSGLRLRQHGARRPVHKQCHAPTFRLGNVDNVDFKSEFQKVKVQERMNRYTTDVGEMTQNKPKNRYRNILPYDQTRVILGGRSFGDDYINASHVQPYRLYDSAGLQPNDSLSIVKPSYVRTTYMGPSQASTSADEAHWEADVQQKVDEMSYDIVPNKSYIAAQGCLPNTKADFWSMIWQEDVRVIAMVTNLVEEGKRKCAGYWPVVGRRARAGSLRMRSVSQTHHKQYVVRELVLKHPSGRKRTIYHYQFTAWPDHGEPEETTGLLAYREDIEQRMMQLVHSEDPPRKNTLCVHCSAGVGRTGTFIVIDMLIDAMKFGGFTGDYEVLEAVCHARSARRGMVQNKEQYRFIYRTLHTVLEAKDKEANETWLAKYRAECNNPPYTTNNTIGSFYKPIEDAEEEPEASSVPAA